MGNTDQSGTAPATDAPAATAAAPATTDQTAPATPSEPMIRWFAYEHLPSNLQSVSRPYSELAHKLIDTVPRNAERTVALRKLLESKDAAVRAAMP